jgi:hypothetical protein
MKTQKHGARSRRHDARSRKHDARSQEYVARVRCELGRDSNIAPLQGFLAILPFYFATLHSFLAVSCIGTCDVMNVLLLLIIL